MHFLYAFVTSIRTTLFVFLFFCLSLLLWFQLSIFLYTLLVTPHYYKLALNLFRYSSSLPYPCSLFPSPPVSLSLSQHRKKKQNTSENTSHHRPKSSNRTNVKSGVSALSSTSNAFGTAASNARLEQTGNGHIDEALRQQALAEEEAAMNQYKVLRYCRLAVYISVCQNRNEENSADAR